MSHPNRSKNPKQKLRFELRGRCSKCKTDRVVWGYIVDNTPAALDAMENRIDKIGGVKALCPDCNAVEDVAFFVDGRQTEPWTNAVEYECKFGRSAGSLPRTPWGREE